MVAVCQGNKSKNDMLVEAVEQYKDMFVRARANFAKVISVTNSINSVTPIRLTCSRAFASISKGMADQAEAEIMGTAVHHPAEITGMVVVLLVAETMVALLMAGMMGMVVLRLLVEMTEMAKEAVTRRETHGTLLPPNGEAHRPGSVGLPLPR